MTRESHWHRTKKLVATLAVSTAATIAAVNPGFAAGKSQDTEKRSVVTMGTDKAGSMVNVMSSALAKVITQSTPVSVRVRAYAGPEAWLPQLDQGRINIGIQSSATAWQTYNQIASQLRLRNMRLLRYSFGSTFQISFMVRKDSDIQSVRDLKGKSVASDFGGHPIIQRLISGAAQAHGLTVQNFKSVPVVGVVDGVQAVIDGRADASWGPFGMPIVREGHSKVGLRFLSLDDTPQVVSTMRKVVFPGVSMTKFQGNVPWVAKGTNLLTYGWYLVANKDLDPSVVRSILKASWDHSEDIKKMHPALRGWDNKLAVLDEPLVPYHPAAVEFYRDKGVWTSQAQAANVALMKSN